MRSIDAYTLVKQRQKRAQRLSRSIRRRAGRIGLGAGILLGLLLAASLILAARAYTSLTSNLPSPQTIAALLEPASGQLLQPTRLYDRSGQHLLAELAPPGIERRFLSAADAGQETFSPALVRLAAAAFPQTRFSFPQLWDPKPHSHAESLAASLLLSGEAPSLEASLRLRLLAWQISRQYTTAQILAAYLNSLQFGRHTFGADAAARAYLGKAASQVDLAEAALLMAVAETPALNPFDAPLAALDRQHQYLYQQVESGAVSTDELHQALQEPLEFAPAVQPELLPGAAFAAHAVEQLALVLGQNTLERGGLVIITSLDYDLQVQLECTLQIHLERLTGQPAAGQSGACETARLLPTLPEDLLTSDDLSASAAVLDPVSGQILALASRNAITGPASHLQPHTAGSLLHPFIYLAGFSHGLGPASLVWDVPLNLPAGQQVPLSPLRYQGPLRLRQALALGAIPPAADLLIKTGPREVWNLAATFGIPENLPDLAASSQASGLFPWAGARVSLLDVLQSFGVMAAGGTLSGQPEAYQVSAAPADSMPFTIDSAIQAELANPSSSRLRSSLVLEVIDGSGRTLLDWRQPRSQSVLSQPLAYLMNTSLSDEVIRWPLLGHPNSLEIGRPAAALNGQTLSGSDVWTVGYTPGRAVVVWAGRAAPPAGTDATALDWRLSASLWNALIKTATRDLPASGWEMPAGVTRLDVCDPSGLLPGPNCPQLVSEVFQQGNEPTQADNLYEKVQVNRETGRLATIFTPPQMVSEQVYMIFPPELRTWAAESGFPQPPESYDTLQAPIPLANAHFSAPAMFSTVSRQVRLEGTAASPDFAYYRIEAGKGINPQEWVQVGESSSQPVDAGLLAEWDTAGLNGLYALRLSVVHTDQTVEMGVLQVMADNAPPTLALIFPEDGQELPAGEVTFEASASDAGGLSQVDWILDGSVIASQSSAPFIFTHPLTAGVHTLQVQAADLAGNTAVSSPISITIQ